MDALSVVGGALLAATFEWLFAKLDSTQLLSFAKQNQVGLELKKWRNLLLKIQAVLEEAETKQITDPLVKIWVSEVRVLAFDMEDILDEFPLLFDEARTNNSSNMFRAWFAGTRRSHSMLDYGIRSKIKDVTDRLQCISSEINGLSLNLTKIAGGDMSKSGSKIIVTTRHCKVASMVGNVAAYHLHALPYDDCLSLFAQHALGKRDFSAHPSVEEIGRGI
ncbi:hypothetical protein Gohar_003773, partial [Gossypium harknessii]|nr:hypothetical protein [Gossypium harknessii]